MSSSDDRPRKALKKTTPRRPAKVRPDVVHPPAHLPAIRDRLGLVCAGGGVTGAIYEIGALAALEDRIEGTNITDFDMFVGVSAGSYISALLANGVTPGLLYRTVTRGTKSGTALDDLALFRLNTEEIARRVASAPRTIFEASWDFYKNRRETTLTDLVQSLGRLLPTGLFQNDGLREWMNSWLGQAGRTDDFRRLERILRIVAVELDTGEPKAFGAPGFDHVPISKAVQASCAIPGLYRPVLIDGKEYIDGGVRKTAHISLAIKERCGLVVCVNPIVPFHIPGSHEPVLNGEQGVLARRGLPAILDQVFRVTLHSRMNYGMARYREDHPDVDIVVFEPRPQDLPRFMSNIMRTSTRVRIAEYGYRTTMAQIDADYPRLAKMFANHGLELLESAPKESLALRFAERLERKLEGDMPTRLAANLELLEHELDRPARKTTAGK